MLFVLSLLQLFSPLYAESSFSYELLEKVSQESPSIFDHLEETPPLEEEDNNEDEDDERSYSFDEEPSTLVPEGSEDQNETFIFCEPFSEENQTNEVLIEHRISGSELIFRGDLLYWKSRQEGLEFTNHPSNVLSTIDFTRSSLIKPEFHWNVGFLLGAAYQFSCSPWTLGLDWTYLHSRAHKHESTETFEGIFPVLSIAPSLLAADYARSAEMHWKLDFNLLDLIARRTIEIEGWEKFPMAFHIGLRNVWIAQNAKAIYTGGSFSAGEDEVRMRSHFYGIGPRVGLDPQWCLGNDFNLYAKASFSLFYGFFDVIQKETFVFVETANTHRYPHGFRWNADLSVGLLREYIFSQNCWKLILDAGVDYLFFNQQNEFKKGPQHLPHRGENLMLWGVHLSAQFQF